jgi:hypothetical protein
MAKMTRSPNQGLSSNKLVHPGVRTGTGAKGVQPGYAAQLGMMKGNHSGRGDIPSKVVIGKDAIGKPAGNTVPFGNEIAGNVGKGGPGAGRKIYMTGVQGQHGPVNPGNRPAPQGPDPMAPWQGSNNAARRSAVKK